VYHITLNYVFNNLLLVVNQMTVSHKHQITLIFPV